MELKKIVGDINAGRSFPTRICEQVCKKRKAIIHKQGKEKPSVHPQLCMHVWMHVLYVRMCCMYVCMYVCAHLCAYMVRDKLIERGRAKKMEGKERKREKEMKERKR